MNKIIWISAAVLSVAACAKNEVIPVNSGENQEITFNVAPKTKAHTEFDKHFKFKSYAYYLPGDDKWGNPSNTNTAAPSLYIDGAEIAYRDKTTGSKEKVWKADKTYYWPKNGSLTFFAYSLNKENLKLDDAAASMVMCDPSQGIYAHIDLSVDKNVDFLVADIKADQKANTTTTGESGKYYTDGVPTLFRHRLSYLAFNVKTDKDYSAAGKKLELKSITFNRISSYGEYRQFAITSFGRFYPSGFNTSYATGHVGTINFTRISTAESPFTMEIKSSGSSISDMDNFLYIPQTFADDSYIEVVYTITTNVGSGSVTEIVTKTIQLNTLFPTKYDTSDHTKVIGGGWEMGKKYTINLTFTLDEILWDPAVQDWDVEGTTVNKPVA